MKVIAINGSARKDGNTAILIERAFEEIRKAGIETERYDLAGKPVRGCLACNQCFQRKDRRCANQADCFNELFEKMSEADGIILASPTYFADVSAEMKAVIDRAGYVSMANDALLKRKVGAAIVAVRRGGAIHAFDTINHFFLISQMIIPGSRYWNVGIGRAKGEAQEDEEGLETMKVLGENLAWLLGKLRG